MSQVQEALVDACTVGYFEDAYLTPEFDYYADNVEDNFEGTPGDTLPLTPEVNDNYFGANVLLTRGNDMVQRIVVSEITMVILLGEHMKTLSLISGHLSLNLKTARNHN